MDLMEIIRLKQDLQTLYGRRDRLVKHLETAPKTATRFIRMRRKDLEEINQEIKNTERKKSKKVPDEIWGMSSKYLFLMKLDSLFSKN